MRPLTLLLALLALLWPGLARAEWRPGEDDQLLFELRAGAIRLGDGVRGYQRPADVCVVLADAILALDVPVRVDRSAGRASGWVFGEGETLAVDGRAGTVTLGGRTTPLPAGAISDVPEGWCVGVGELGRWLGVTLRPDLSNASLHIETSRKLPFQLAAERRARAAALRPRQTFDLATLPQTPTPYRAWRTPALDVVASAGAASLSGAPRTGDLRFELFASGEALGLSLDARLGSDDRGRPERLRARAYRADPAGGLPGGATLIEAGDVSGVASPLVTAGVQGRGAAITNRPLTEPDTFSTTSFVGDLPAGWEAELYRGDELIALAAPRDDGRYEFRAVPLRFGTNDFAVVLYGPHGQVRREERSVRVGASSIPPERTWYWMSANDAGRDLLGGAGVLRGTLTLADGLRTSLLVEHGLSTRTSLFAGAHSGRFDTRRRTTVEGGVRHAFNLALTQFTAAWAEGGWAFAAEALGGRGRTSVSLRALAAHDFVSDRVESGLSHELVAAVDTAVGRDGATVPVRGAVRWRVDRSGAERLEAQARASVNVGRVFLTGEVDWNRSRRAGLRLVGPGVDAIGFGAAGSAATGLTTTGPVAADGTGAAATGLATLSVDGLSAALLANAALGEVRVRAGARVAMGPARLDVLNLTAERALGMRGRLRLDADWRPASRLGPGRGRLAVGYSRRFDRLALGGRVEAGTDGGLAAGVDLQLSLARDRDGGVRLSSERLASTGRAEVRVFRDLNGDGRWQAGEPPEPDVRLIAGTARVTRLTDRDGVAVIEGLIAQRAVLVGVDASSLPDPLLLPAGPGRVIVPRPGVAAAIDLPLTISGAVEGTLQGANGASLGGVDLELVDEGGVVVATTRSEFDGVFAFDQAPYGRLTLRIGALAAAAIRVSPTLGVAVTLSDDTPVARLGTVVPRPLPANTLAAADRLP